MRVKVKSDLGRPRLFDACDVAGQKGIRASTTLANWNGAAPVVIVEGSCVHRTSQPASLIPLPLHPTVTGPGQA
jgi:hypothetical protein